MGLLSALEVNTTFSRGWFWIFGFCRSFWAFSINFLNIADVFFSIFILNAKNVGKIHKYDDIDAKTTTNSAIRACLWSRDPPARGDPFIFRWFFIIFDEIHRWNTSKIHFPEISISKFFLSESSIFQKCVLIDFTDDIHRKYLKTKWKSKGPPLLFSVSETTRPSKGGPFDFRLNFNAFLLKSSLI